MGRGVKRPALPAADALAACAELLAAVTELGGMLDGVQPQVIEGMGLGLVAERDLPAGHAVLRLPAAAVVTTEAALASPIGAAIAAEFEVVRDEHAEEAETGAAADWRSEWVEREARWAREEAAEAAEAAGKRGGKGTRRRAAREASPVKESSSAPSDSDEGDSDGDDDGQQRRRVGVRSVLYAYLIAARAANSALPAAHAAYARSLPAAFDAPLLWPDAECAELLAGTELARSVALMRDHLRNEYDVLFPRMCAAAPSLFRKQLFTWPAFLWAHAAYSSRCFAASCAPGAAEAGAEADGLVGESDAAAAHGVLLPLLDIGNHAPEGADIRWDAATGTAVLKRAMKAGEQMYNCYGTKDTGAWLLHFGFAPWHNLAEAVPLRLAATFPDDSDGAASAASEAAAERARGRKQRLFAELGGGRLALVCTLRRGPLPPMLLAAARVCCMSPQEAASAGGETSGALAGPISASNERAALSYVRELLARRIAGLLSGDSAAAWVAHAAAARAKDAVWCGRDGAEIAVTRVGASVAYRNGQLEVLQLAADAVETALAAL